MKSCYLLTALFSLSAILEINAQSLDTSFNHKFLIDLNTSLDTISVSDGSGLAGHITGTSVFNINSNPLIVINGIPCYNLYLKDFDFSTANLNDYAIKMGISANDIESISFLNDGPSAAKYGYDGASGIICIKTKQGNGKKLNVDYTFRNTLSFQPEGYKMLNQYQYESLILDGYWNSNLNPYYLEDGPFANDPNDPYYYYNFGQNTNWQDAIIRKGSESEHNLSFSGKYKNLGYYLSTGYINNKSTTIGIGSSQFNGNINIDYHLKNLLNIRAGLMYSNIENDSIYEGFDNLPIWELAVKKMPNMSIYRFNSDGTERNDYFTDDSPQGYQNPVALANTTDNNYKTKRFIPTISVNINPLHWLGYSIDYSLQQTKTNRDIYAQDGIMLYTLKSTETYTKKRYYFNNELTITPKLGKSHILILNALYSMNKINVTNEEFSKTIQYGDTSTSGNDYWSDNKIHLASIRTSYQVFNKYMIEIGISGNKLNDNKSINYDPSASFKWIISNEKFLNTIRFIDNLSADVSYSENTNPNPSYSDFSKTSKYLNLNLSVLNKKLIFRLSGYNLTNKLNMSSEYSIPASSVYPNFNNRYWNIQNKGWEFNISSTLVKTDKLSVLFNLNLNKNYLSLKDIENASFPVTYTSSGNGTFQRIINKGKTIGDLEGYKCNGVYADADATIARDAEGNILTDVNNENITTTYKQIYTFNEGDAKYADLNYDGIINNQDITKIGNVNPVLSGSGGPSFVYKKWSLGFYFNFRIGNDIANIARMNLENMYSYNNQTTTTLRRWEYTGDITDIPRALFNRGYNWLGSNRFIENGSFLRLKSITLQHEFSNSLIQKMHLSNLSFFIIAQNLFTITKYSGVDPDILLHGSISNFGYDTNYKPIAKEFTFGFNIGL
jgi:TonB-dependent SusC/RagA subfamily outer membrane receptor